MVLCYRSLNRLRQPITSEKNLGKLLLWTSAPEGYCELKTIQMKRLVLKPGGHNQIPVLPLTNLVTLDKLLKLQGSASSPEKQRYSKD